MPYHAVESTEITWVCKKHVAVAHLSCDIATWAVTPTTWTAGCFDTSYALEHVSDLDRVIEIQLQIKVIFEL